MNLVCVGISHHTAPLDQRERLWFSREEIREFLPRLRQQGYSEAVLFSTCNRTELYTFSDREEADPGPLSVMLLEAKSASDVPKSSLFTRKAAAAGEHLFRVAAGIDSMVVGDVQILAQVKEGYQLAQTSETVGFFMNRLFQAAFHAGKRARTETGISEGAVSVSYAAVELAEKIFSNLREKRALVIGAGETAHLTAKHLRSRSIGTLYVTNRTYERAERLAKAVGGTALPFDEYCHHFNEIDILISSVESERCILTADDLRRLNRNRTSSALFIIDIGVPRNIDPAAGRLDNVFLYDIDGLNAVINENLQRRMAEVPRIEAIVREEIAGFESWFSSLHVHPTIATLRERLEQIRHDEVEKNINRFSEQDRELVNILTRRIINKIFHGPIVNLRNGDRSSLSQQLQKISLLRELFGLDQPAGDRRDDA